MIRGEVVLKVMNREIENEFVWVADVANEIHGDD